MPDQIGSTPISNPAGTPPVGDLSSVTPGIVPAANSGVQASNAALSPSASPAISQGSLSPADVQALTSSWQQRLSGMQSLADTRLDERNKAITAQAQLQQQYAALQEQAHTNIAAAAEAAQNAINTANQLKAESIALQGELRRYKALEAHPELSPYRKFIPTNGTEDELNATITELKSVREQDLAKVQAGQQPLFANPTMPGAQSTQVPGTPGAPVQQFQPNLLQGLYGNRPSMNPMLMGMPQTPLMPGSTPAAMSPTGGSSTTQSIAQMMREAMASGDMEKYEQARQRATALLPQAIQEQLG